MSLESLPTECFNIICVHLPIEDVPKISVCSKTLRDLCGSDNGHLWNLLLCHRVWTVDPSTVIPLEGTEDVHWMDLYREMVNAECQHQQYLDDLKILDLDGWLERHFLGQLAPRWNGWERRFWSWSSRDNSFAAWEDDTRRHCYAQFPVGPDSVVRRISTEEQIALSTQKLNDLNPVTNPKPFVFTITNTSFPMLWACSSEEQLQLWLDKISVTLHPLKFGGRTYKAPAKYLLKKTT